MTVRCRIASILCIAIALGCTVAVLWLTTLGAFLEAHNQTISALATLVIAAFTITLWWTASRQSRLTQDAIALARDEFLATHRPKIIVHSTEIDWRDSDEGPCIGARVTIVNAGASEALLESIDCPHSTPRRPAGSPPC